VSKMDFAAMRAAMVDSQLRTSDVNDLSVVAAMAHVEREKFVPADKAASAYIDRAISLGAGRMMNPPLATGRLLNAAGVKAGEKVLLIGAAGGYTAAVLAAMGANVVAVEEDASLSAGAKLPKGVTSVSGSLAVGAPKKGPYDVLIVDGAVEELPKALTDQLVENGRIVTGIVERGVTRVKSGRKVADAVGLASLFDMEMAILPGFSKPAVFSF
jgi:protein-L-isoaspartate(D-aspartate) O-methyltransferase